MKNAYEQDWDQEKHNSLRRMSHREKEGQKDKARNWGQREGEEREREAWMLHNSHEVEMP